MAETAHAPLDICGDICGDIYGDIYGDICGDIYGGIHVEVSEGNYGKLLQSGGQGIYEVSCRTAPAHQTIDIVGNLAPLVQSRLKGRGR